MNNKIAVLDLGSQTFRLAVAEVESKSIEILCSELVNVRLGEGLSTTGMLSAQAIERALLTLKRFGGLIERYKVERVRACGTEALRRAKNASVFIDAAHKAGFSIEILTGEDEAALSAAGVCSTLEGLHGISLIVDVGGGSTEFILINGNEILFSRSVKIGVVGLTEKFLRSDPLADKEFEMLERYVKNIFDEIKQEITYLPHTIIGAGGSATTAGAMSLKMSEYDPMRIRGLGLTVKELNGLLSCLKRMRRSERNAAVGLAPERADIIPAGIVVFLSVLSAFNIQEMIITDGGLLMGLLVNSIQKEFSIDVRCQYTSSLYL
ncbi:MAG: Ppx/GppA phosphatase family protein [Dissulfurimicrobium sp.]|uniref:Ppx/GppA phosphatase family protein n=1 Tax=Dissulfurimicrobium sp. TaxID=2022436 RepID=UPI0040494A6C